MTHTDLYPRHAARPLAEALAYSPVRGPRQCGKTAPARSVGGPLGYSYVGFDEDYIPCPRREWARPSHPDRRKPA